MTTLPWWIDQVVLLASAAGILALAARLALHPEDHRRVEIGVATFGATIPFYLAITLFVGWLGRVMPWRYDLYLAEIGTWFGNPSFAIGHLLLACPPLLYASALAYKVLPAAGAILFAVYLFRRPESEAFGVLKTLMLNAALSVPCYLLLPASGPAYAFSSFPADPGAVHPGIISLAAPPNAMPSIHFSTALLIAWFARPWLVGRVLGTVFVALTFLATLGSGEHYLIDLVAAVPYAWCIASRRPSVSRLLQPVLRKHGEVAAG